MKEGNQPLLSLTIAGVSSPHASSVGSPPSISSYPAPAPLSDFLERVFESPYPTAQGISSYLDIEDIINLRNTCKLHQTNIQDKGRWAWLLNRLSTRKVDYPNPDPRIRRLSLGVPPSSREGYVGGREFVIIDVSAGDRDFLKLNSNLYNIGAFETLTSLILDGTNIDAGDVGHLLRKLQNTTTLSLRHCWNVNLQLLYKLFKKTSEAHIEEVNYFNGINQERSKSKSPAEQIQRLRIWDIDGIQVLLDESPENGHRLVSQIGVQFFIRNFETDVGKCESTHHSIFMLCVGEKVQCGSCKKYLQIEVCPKCRFESSCEICETYLCVDCVKDSKVSKSPHPATSTPARIPSEFTTTLCRTSQCKWHDNRHYNHPECLKLETEKCLYCSRHICLLQRRSMNKSFNCEACRKFSCGCRQLQHCSRCQGYMCDDCLSHHGNGCQWQKG
ncbi:hypothetical protein TWF569_002982 [Orbilia oligospora]|uniref:F-box domain-containing protein n=1 Tax=Orbilia oligospora TaxID=2813651 RepID=A0A7C8NXB4_ORBOL|nr:hypothetical protein TWF706_007390 [Orbilia oligospora]KAF3097138.1 hypothetical protein TWF706_007390 [Orbilia oligospora]KAF3111423.1 hypothetical protein TWF102_007088 [Orbilia oligospora]KAF3117247.1 hypothetical protein TWF103_007392 [Orbilia oligospora]KAF3117248.1 hypothetical protein TWF103_007392 [Orbilia oligospora]